MRIIDVNSFIGHWFSRPVQGTAAQRLREMDRVGIESSFVSPLEAFLYDDPHEANEALFRTTRKHTARLEPVPVIAPGLPLWREELHQYLDQGVRMVRVIPAFRPEALHQANVKLLAETLVKEDVLLVFQWMIEDYRSFHGLVKPLFPNRQQVMGFLSTMPCRVILGGITFIEAEHILANTGETVFVELSYMEKTQGLESLVTPENSKRILFGTMAPLLIAEAARMKVTMSQLDSKTKSLIFAKNVLQLFPNAFGR